MRNSNNKENDLAIRAGVKAVVSANKRAKTNRNKLKDPATKKATLDFIFGGDTASVSPLV